jgi:AAA domain
MTELGHIEFLAVDTMSRALAGGDENSSKDMGAFVRNCDLIRSATGAHLCSLHHLGKDESRGARGHSLLKAALDTELTATRSGRIGSLEVTKQRDGPNGIRWSFTIDPVDVSEGKQSYVVIPADAPPASKANRWSRGLAVFHDAALAALLAHGQEHRPAGDGPIVKACLVTDVRAEHKRLYVHNGDGERTEAERKAWARALKTARDSNLLSGESRCGRDLIWLLS